MSRLFEDLREALAPQYEVERELASGGMGTVFVAHDTVLDRKVAVKVVRPQQASPAATERLLQEARCLASFSHPNIVPIHSAGEFGGCYYYIMDYIEGDTLAERLKQGPLSTEESVRLADDLLAALEEAHKHGVVHRDVKPKNVFLVDGRALLVDFGVAKRIQAESGQVTSPGRPVGTPGYMAPEQYLGEEVTEATDIYAVGMTVYEALTGRQWTVLAPTQEMSWSGVPLILIPALRRALEWSPGDRWPDAASFRKALRTVAPWTKRRRLALTVTGAIAAAVVLGAAGWILLKEGTAPTSAYAVEDPRQSYLILPFVVTTDDEELNWLVRGGAHMLTSDLETWQEIRVVDRRRLDALAEARAISLEEPVDLDNALQLARDARVGTLVLGEALAHAGEVEIVVRLYDVAKREELGDPERTNGPASEVWPMFDQVAARILKLAGAPDVTPDLRARTTTSLQAYQLYLTGLQQLYRFELDEATRAFLSALAYDSTFALAYYRLATALWWNKTAALNASEAAVRHSERLSSRTRDHILAFNAFQHDNFELARQMYLELLATDSTDAEAWYYIGEVEFNDYEPVETEGGVVRPRGSWNRALQGYLRAVELDPTFHLGYGNAFEIYRLTASGSCNVPWEDATRTLTFCPRWQDSVTWVQAETPLDTAYLSAVAPALWEEAIGIAKRWANAAPDEARPHAELRDLYMLRRRHLGVGTGDEGALTYARLALDAERARARLVDLAPEERIQLAGLYLASGIYDTAAALAGAAVAQLEIEQKNLPPAAANFFIVGGQPGRALEVLARHDTASLPDTLSIAEVEPGAVIPLVETIEILGSTSADRMPLRAALYSLRTSWPETEDQPEEIERLIASELRPIGPALVLIGSGEAKEWLDRLDRLPLSWQSYLDAMNDSAKVAWGTVNDFLAWAEAHPQAVAPFDLYLVGLAAQALGRDSLAIDLFSRIDLQPFAIRELDPRWGLLSQSYLLRARSYQAIADTAKAIRYYQLFASLWREAEPDLQAKSDEALGALGRLRPAEPQ